MKKLVLSFVLLTAFICVSVTPAFAEEAMSSEAVILTEENEELVNGLMAIRDMDAALSYEVLYSHEDIPKFILAIASNGYLIVDKDSWVVVEHGSGHNPYVDYPSAKKFYGGVGCAVIEVEGGYLHTETGETLSVIPYIQGIDLLGDASNSGQRQYEPNAVVTATEKTLPNYESHIRQLAFGNNESGTCTAVACGIVLNYLDRNVSQSFVPDNMESEELRNRALDNTPNAQLLHTTLIDCGIDAPATPVSAYSGMYNYIYNDAERAKTGLLIPFATFASSSDCFDFLKSEIDKGIPAVLSTTVAPDLPVSYALHSMAVYGYRVNSDGSQEIAVHTGWTSKISTNAPFIVEETWIPALPLSSVNQFQYQLDGWHETPTGWKYYEAGQEVPAITIARQGGLTRYNTAALIAMYERSSSNYAVVVSGADTAWPDALAAAGLAGIYNAPVLTTDGTYLSSETASALSALGVKYVYVVGGFAPVSDGVLSSIRALPSVSTVTRIYGDDRFKTAEAVYNRVSSSWLHPTGGYEHPYYSSDHTWKNGTRKKAVILATGTNWPDAMAASSLSAYAHFPILLVRADGTLTNETKVILRNGRFDQVYCAGGGITAAAGVACSLVDPADIVGAPIYGGGTFVAGQNWYTRIIGNTRYETAREAFHVSRSEGMRRNKVAISSGITPVNGLPGGAMKYPLLLADSNNSSVAQTQITRFSSSVNTLIILGGTSTVSDSVVDGLVSAWWQGKVGSSPFSAIAPDDVQAAPDGLQGTQDAAPTVELGAGA